MKAYAGSNPALSTSFLFTDVREKLLKSSRVAGNPLVSATRAHVAGTKPLQVHSPHKPEQMPCHLAHLNLFRPFGNAVAAVVAVDMLKGFVA